MVIAPAFVVLAAVTVAVTGATAATAATAANGDANDVTPGRAGVVAVAGESGDALRSAIVEALKARDGWDVQTPAYVDGVVQDLAGAGVLCTGSGAPTFDDAHDACWLKVAVNGGLDVLVVGALGGDGRTLTLRLVDARAPAAPRVARGDVANVASVVAALVSRPAPAPPPTHTTTPTTTTTTHVPPPTTTTTPATPAPAASSNGALWVVTIAAGVVAVACTVTALVMEQSAEQQIADWNPPKNVPLVKSKWDNTNAIEIGAIVGAAGAGAVAVGVGFIALE